MISDETREIWDDKIDAILKACDMRGLNLNDWENDFINSIYNIRLQDEDLTYKQSKVLNRIYNKIE